MLLSSRHGCDPQNFFLELSSWLAWITSYGRRHSGLSVSRHYWWLANDVGRACGANALCCYRVLLVSACVPRLCPSAEL